MSMVKMVDAELKIDVSDDIKAANITANIKPLIPEKTSLSYIIQLIFLPDAQRLLLRPCCGFGQKEGKRDSGFLEASLLVLC